MSYLSINKKPEKPPKNLKCWKCKDGKFKVIYGSYSCYICGASPVRPRNPSKEISKDARKHRNVAKDLPDYLTDNEIDDILSPLNKQFDD